MKNRIYIRGILLCGFLLVSMKSIAQVVTFNELNTYIQKVRVGLVDEFFDRFNGKTTHPDIPATKKNSRRNNLLMLYNLSMFKSKEDPHFAEAAKMMDAVIADSVMLHYADTTWAALAHCKGTMDGKIISFDLYLTVQHRKQDMYKWVISRVEGKFFDIDSRDKNENIMLMPDDHETNFLSLKRMTAEQSYNVGQFMAKGFDYDQTSVFAYLVHSGKLKIKYVDDLEFVFTQIPGYIFHIKYFEREKNNAGWLISNFYETTEKDKTAFMRKLYPRKGIVKDEAGSLGFNPEDSLDMRKSGLLSPKDLFYKRRDMRLAQLYDYMQFIQKDEQRARYYYIDKFKAMFVEGSKVLVSRKDSVGMKSISVDSLCNMLVNRKNKLVRVDSVSVPVWDDKLLNLSSSTGKIPLTSCLWTISAMRKSDDVENNAYGQQLYAYREDTEDGMEWIPMFGDLMVTIK